MSLAEALKAAGSGWTEILAERPGWRAHFDFSPEGVNRVSIVYFGAVMIALVANLLVSGMIAPVAMIFLLLTFLLPALALVAATALARKAFDVATPLIELVVPGLYLHALMVLVDGLLTAAGLAFTGALIGLSGFLLYKLGRTAAGLDMVRAFAYAVFNVVLLIGLPLGLYLAAQSLFS